MTKSDFEAIINHIRQKISEMPEICRSETEAEILEFRFAGERVISHFVNLDSLELYDSFCIFELLLETLVSWADEIHTRRMILPYHSVVAVEETVHADDEVGLYSTFKLIVRNEIKDE